MAPAHDAMVAQAPGPRQVNVTDVDRRTVFDEDSSIRVAREAALFDLPSEDCAGHFSRHDGQPSQRQHQPRDGPRGHQEPSTVQRVPKHGDFGNDRTVLGMG